MTIILFPMKKLSEGKKMFWSVMVIFAIYAIIFILFDDYDRTLVDPFEEASDWHLLLFSLLVMTGLAFLLHRYSKRMDERIMRERTEKEGQMRRELTQNIAHELKTPVASILGYAETMKDNPDMENTLRNQFINRTYVQAQRLTALLRDISTLNRIDFAQTQIEKKPIDVAQIVSEITWETASALKEKNMRFKNYLPEHIVVKGNESLIYSVFRNLFDNSINYAGEGVVIELSAKKDNGMWFFTFSDNGQGIDDVHLPRLFERFYRVDKGRSRQLGGTGLGLAIVKNAVMLHGGTVKAYKNGQRGMAFYFSIAVNM